MLLQDWKEVDKLGKIRVTQMLSVGWDKGYYDSSSLGDPRGLVTLCPKYLLFGSRLNLLNLFFNVTMMGEVLIDPKEGRMVS